MEKCKHTNIWEESQQLFSLLGHWTKILSPTTEDVCKRIKGLYQEAEKPAEMAMMFLASAVQ